MTAVATTSSSPGLSNRPIRILHLVPWLCGGGVERRRLALARQLDPDRFEQRILCIEAEPPISTGIAETDVAYEAIGGTWSPGDIRSIRHIARTVRRWQPDIVHGSVYEGVTMASIAGRLGGAERIIVEEIDYPIYRSWKGNALFKTLATAATKCVGVSPAVMEYFDEIGLPDSKVVEVLNGTERRDDASPTAVEAVRREFDLPEDAFVVGTVGRLLDSHKRVSDLVRAFELLREEIPELYLLIVGGGHDHDELVEWTAELGHDDRVIYTGRRDDVGTLLNLMDVFALASSRESFGLVLVEAMYEGLPVIATRVGGPKRIVVEA
ncbi:MAG: glycosyltransferase, partial [Persicimonas sp.]